MRNKNLRNRRGKLVMQSHSARFPKEPESRLEALVTSLNSEPKQVLVLSCLDDKEWRTSTELWYNWKKLEAEWQPSRSCLKDYCEYSLIPSQLAETHSILYQNTNRPVTRYRLSKAGNHYGRRAAAVMLQYSIKNQESLYAILGSRNSPGRSRAPNDRIDLMELLASGVTSSKELAEQLKLSRAVIRKHWRALRSSGLIKYHPKYGRLLSEVEVTPTGEEFLEKLITPLYSLCRDTPHELVEAAYSLFEDPQIIRDYAVEGIKQYRNYKFLDK